MERCAGCGIAAESHPMVGITRIDADPTAEFTAVPVCQACWLDPAHRTLGPLKAHFHARRDAPSAIFAANAYDAASRRGEDLGLRH